MKKYLAIILAILTFAAVFPPIVGSAAALLEKHFGIGSADIALSKNYNPDDNTVIIKNKALFELSHRDICVFNPDNKEWTYINEQSLLPAEPRIPPSRRALRAMWILTAALMFLTL